mmetsp:Transcript_20787/g.44341  ORF Transcript_20787/g.44341 Transcript_20787/m.44341 type:complete len:128 (-) Transcript_20787:59-442(-)
MSPLASILAVVLIMASVTGGAADSFAIGSNGQTRELGSGAGVEDGNIRSIELDASGHAAMAAEPEDAADNEDVSSLLQTEVATLKQAPPEEEFVLDTRPVFLLQGQIKLVSETGVLTTDSTADLASA